MAGITPAEREAVASWLSGESCVRVFVAGAVSHVGKTTVCLAILGYLEACGIAPSEMAYVKPATQCEAADALAVWCEAKGVRHVGGTEAPLVFYSGLTRAVIARETARIEPSAIAARVDELCRGKKFCVIDGVGFPGVGSCVGASNADVAAACRAPVVLVGKAGVGSAIDAHCGNAALFHQANVPVLGAVFNKADTDGFYAADKIRLPIETFFRDSRPRETCYGVVPAATAFVDARDTPTLSKATDAIHHLATYLDFHALIQDVALDVFNRKRRPPPPPLESSQTEHRDALPTRVDIEARARADGAVPRA